MKEEIILIDKATYTHKIDAYNISELVCNMSDGEIRTYYFYYNNPMPKPYVIEGNTWEYMTGVVQGMFRMGINECAQIKDRRLRI